MIKKLLLASAFALTMLSGSYAQVDKVVDSSYYTTGDVNVYSTANADFGTPTLDGSGNVVIPCTKTTNTYDAIAVAVNNAGTNTTFPFPNIVARPRTIKLMISANPAATIRVAVQDGTVLANTTDANVPTINATPTMQLLTATFVAGDFISEYNGGNGCSKATPCYIDSTQIAYIQLDPNPGADYTGTITIAYIYAGDSLASDVVLTSPSQVSSSIVAGTSYTLSASSSAPIDSLRFMNGTQWLASVTTPPYNYTWTNVPQGKYVITAVGYSGGNPSPSSADTLYANPAPTITGLPVEPAGGYTVTTDSGFYSRGDTSIFSGLGTADYDTATVDANGNVVINNHRPGGTNDYAAIIVNLPKNIHLPKHAMQATISIAASSPVTIRYALEDANTYVTDQISPQNVDVASGAVAYAPTVITVPFNTAASLQDFNSNGTSCSSTAPCTVDTSMIAQLQILPTGGNSAYTGTIVIGYIYVGDTTQAVLGVTSAVATAATSLYPNPATGVANYNVAVSGDITATLSDMTGKVVSTQNGSAGSFNVSGLNSGVYVVSFALNGAYYTTQKLVVSGN